MSTVKDFRCNSCGAPLPIPKNSRGHVKCPSCKTECVIEGLVKNAEMADKENINSGLPLTASPATLHRKLVSFLAEVPSMPLDVFEKGEVVREEHYCVAAYYFYCNGSASYTYDVAEIKQRKYTVDRGDSTEIRTENYEEWKNGINGTASTKGHFVAPGNKKMVSQIKKLYSDFDPNKLISYDELEFPHDVETYGYDLPQAVAFDEHVVSIVDKMLKEQALNLLAKQKTRNFTMGSSSIQKDITRIFLGLYHIIFKYGDKEYSVWVTGDGQKAFHEGLPVDTQRQKALEEKQKAKEQGMASIAPPKTGLLNFGKWVCVIIGIFMGIMVLVYLSAGAGREGLPIIAIFITFITGAIIFGTRRSKKWEEYDAQRGEVGAKFQKEIDDFNGQATNVVQQFRAQKKALCGIYEEVTGDANAF